MARERELSYREELRRVLAEYKAPSWEELRTAGHRLASRLPPPPKKLAVQAVPWSTPGPRGRGIRCRYTSYFNARGMRRLYGRADQFDGFSAKMGVWQAKDGRVLARFWSRSGDMEPDSFEVVGLSVPTFGPTHRPADGEQVVPKCLRDEYENWLGSALSL